MMGGYSPEEYEELKEFYKRDWRERQSFLKELRYQKLRQRAEWHLRQMEDSLRALGITPDASSSSPADPSSPADTIDASEDKTLL